MSNIVDTTDHAARNPSTAHGLGDVDGEARHGDKTMTNSRFRTATSCSSSLMPRGPRLVAQKAIETFLAKRSCQRQTQGSISNGTIIPWPGSDSILMGLIFDDRGNRMTPTYAVKKGARYRYYVSSALRGGPVGAANAQVRRRRR